jgi:glycine cleavage system transcriptional repressor
VPEEVAPKAVIATIGEDRPGIVADLASLVLDTGANIEDSRMTVLGGEFAVLMSVSGADADLTELETAIKALSSSSDIAYLFRRTSDRGASSHNVVDFTVEAMDHPGIVQSVAGFFSQRGINIRSLNTETSPAAHTGTPVFTVLITAEVPSETDLSTLSDDFVDFCESRNLDGATVSN